MSKLKNLLILSLFATIALAACNNGNVPITGNAVLSIGSNVEYFESTLVGNNSNAIQLVLHNVGDESSGVPNIRVDGTDYHDFAIESNACTMLLESGESCTVAVIFTPTTNGFRHARLTATAVPGGTTVATLLGVGLESSSVAPPPQ